jgi:hypothetical protein
MSKSHGTKCACNGTHFICHEPFLLCHNALKPNVYVTMHWNQICMSQCIATKFVCHNATESHFYIPNHTLYVTMSRNLIFLELVSGTVIFWTEFSYSNKAMLLLCWSHSYNYFTVIITILLTVTKYPSNDNGSFPFYVDFFLSSITVDTFTGLYCIYE